MPYAYPQPAAKRARVAEHGLAYSVMTFSLGFAAISLGSVLHGMIALAGGAEVPPLMALWLTVLLIAAPFAIASTRYVGRTEEYEPEAKQSGTRAALGNLLLVSAACVGLGRLFIGVYLFSSQVLLGAASATSVTVLSDVAHVAITVGIAGGLFWGGWRWLYGDRPKPWHATNPADTTSASA